MSQDYDASAQREWLDGLDEERLSAALETIAGLPAERRRAALANPLPYLEQEGLRPPAGIEVKLLDKELDPAGFPHLLPPPELSSLSQLPLAPFCFRICWLGPWIVRGRTIGLKQMCRLFCILP
ncbi:MAG: hypothetical protein QOJ53_565 [Sphingomonadales bacterium]|jgi:hypothetical protein|nr:hypothetical protein [Sphingomonadales bacterium]